MFQEVGASTIKMSELKAGDSFRDFVGPLGCPSEFVHEDIEELKKKKMVFVAGGVGTAPVYPQVKWLHEHGITADVILGSKTKDMVILEERACGCFQPLCYNRRRFLWPFRYGNTRLSKTSLQTKARTMMSVLRSDR